MKSFNTDYIDTFQFTASVFYEFGFERCVDFVEKMISKNIFRYTSITNENLDLFKRYHSHFGDMLFSHEVGFNFEVRENETEGTIPYANSNNIRTVVYQPLRRNRTANRNWPVLVDLSKKYGITQNQLILSWLISKNILPLTKSENIDHINEYLETINIKLDVEDCKKIDEFKLNYVSPKIDWEKTGEGIDVSQLSNVFDEEYDKQQKI